MAHRERLSRKPGARLPADTVSVAYPTKWVNPFRPATRNRAANAAAVDQYCRYLEQRPDLVAAARAELAARISRAGVRRSSCAKPTCCYYSPVGRPWIRSGWPWPRSARSRPPAAQPRMPVQRALRPALPVTGTAIHLPQRASELRAHADPGGEPVGRVLTAPTHPGIGERTHHRAHRHRDQHERDRELPLLDRLHDRDNHRGGDDDAKQAHRLPAAHGGQPNADHQPGGNPPQQSQPDRDQREPGRSGRVMA
jgi:hypothetical protein